jgi:hypothetical protein
MKRGEDIMESSKKTEPNGLTRRDALKLPGVALGGLAIGGTLIRSGAGKAHADEDCQCPVTLSPEQAEEHNGDDPDKLIF